VIKKESRWGDTGNTRTKVPLGIARRVAELPKKKKAPKPGCDTDREMP